MSAANSPNPVGWPVFVVWSKGKGRPVIDLRGLNSKVTPDAYPLPRQDDVIGLLKGKYWIALFDLLKAYYQRIVALLDRWKLTVLTHRGQEVLNVAPMGFINSASHMQKLMDLLLEIHKAYAKCFVDDTVVFSDDFESHLKHIEAVLRTMEEAGMTLSPTKCYVGYHSIELLGHHVDRFGLSTLEQKVEAIAKLRFPASLRELEYFLGLTGWYRHFVARYAALIDPLQKLKTRMLKKAPKKGRERETFSRSTKIVNPTALEVTAFLEVKAALCDDKLVIIHPDINLPLIFHVDSSAENGMACAVHQVPQNTLDENNLTYDDVVNGNYHRKLEKPVLYLSRALSRHEHNYWPTELEIAGIVWSIQKTRHLIEGTKCAKVYTDHKSAKDVLTSESLKTSSAVRQNLRLIRASQFLSQYQHVRIIYRPGRDMVNADAISRLHKAREGENPQKDEDVFGFLVTVIGISGRVLREIENGYTQDKHLQPIYQKLKDKCEDRISSEDRTTNDDIVRFSDIRNDRPGDGIVKYQGFHARYCNGHLLLYMTDPIDNHHRLCIPHSAHKTFFEAVHDGANHAGYHKCYRRLRLNYYIQNMARLLRKYIGECPTCATNSNINHKPHGKLQPLQAPELPFEFITIDHIFKLPPSTFDNNT